MRKLECTITVRGEPLAEEIFKAEEKEFKHGRSEYTVEQKGEDTIITVEADDPVALRATVTSVTRILNIVQRT